MLRFVIETFHRLIKGLSFEKTRYLYSAFQIRERLTGLIGSRGVGKTTLLLQYIKNQLVTEGKCLYFSADLVYFQDSNLLEFVERLHVREGYQILFIDEIHKYRNWNQELKNIYDSFPELKIVFSGSSMLDLVQGSYDLSRRAKLYHLHGMSFREYLNHILHLSLEPISFQMLLQDSKALVEECKKIERLFIHFETYLKQGYYPFVWEDPHSYHEKVSRIIEKTIFEDIANYYNLKTPHLPSFKRILAYLASIPPGEFSLHSLAKHLQLDHKTIEHYLSILHSVGLITYLRRFEVGGVGLRKPAKVLLHNTTLLHTLEQHLGKEVSKGMEMELFFVQSLQNAGIEVFYSKQGDYRTREAVFEIGGKSKTRKQLKGAEEPAYLVKDDILQPLKGEIPLFLFGFLY